MNFKSFRFKNIIFIVLLVLLFVEVLIIFPNQLEKNKEELPPQAVQEEDANSADAEQGRSTEQKMQGLHLVESQSGKRDWELFSEVAYGSQGTGQWNLRKVRVLFYNQEKVEYTVTGDEGNIDSKTKDLYIRGKVFTQSANGYTFETPSIYYKSGKRLIESPEQVTMRGPHDKNGNGMVLHGSRMNVDVDQSQIVIHDKVRAEKGLGNNKNMQIQADRAEFSGKNRQAKFFGQVSMVYDKMRVEGPQANFLYKENADILSTVQVVGGVKVNDEDKFASAENLDLDLLANKFTFKGSPRVIQEDNELIGDEIIFLDGGKRVKVERVKARVDK